MKKLCLVRHAKSRSAHSKSDLERPLEEQGEYDARRMGEILSEKKLVPDLILTSHARRSFDTASLLAQALDYPQEKIIVEEKLYEAGIEDLIAVIQRLNSNSDTVILIGHNPGLTWLANYLAEDHEASLPACSVYCIEFATEDWQEITWVEGKKLFMEAPNLHSE